MTCLFTSYMWNTEKHLIVNVSFLLWFREHCSWIYCFALLLFSFTPPYFTLQCCFQPLLFNLQLKKKSCSHTPSGLFERQHLGVEASDSNRETVCGICWGELPPVKTQWACSTGSSRSVPLASDLSLPASESPVSSWISRFRKGSLRTGTLACLLSAFRHQPGAWCGAGAQSVFVEWLEWRNITQCSQ